MLNAPPALQYDQNTLYGHFYKWTEEFGFTVFFFQFNLVSLDKACKP